jgi:hypothetical protein
MIAPVAVFLAVTCLLLALAGVVIAAFALIKYSKTHELSLMIGALALIWSAMALLIQALTFVRHFP